jgi:hypothetical protein
VLLHCHAAALRHCRTAQITIAQTSLMHPHLTTKAATTMPCCRRS